MRKRGSVKNDTRTLVAPLAAVLAVAAIAWLGLDNWRLKRIAARIPNNIVTASLLGEGDRLPEVEIREIEPSGSGMTRKNLDEVLGGIDILFFYTTTCPYCRASFPTALELREQAARIGVDLLGVSLRRSDAGYEETAPPGWKAPILSIPDPREAARLGVARVPTLVLIDPEQRVSRIWSGELTEQRSQEILTAAQQLTIGR